MSFSSKTYSVGDSGGVRKLIDLVGPWVDVSLPANGIPGAAAGHLFDVETDPNDGNKVFVVGEGFCSAAAPNWYGIGVSSNGGVTWQVPGGNYQNLVNNINCYYRWHEVTVVNSNVIYACGIVDVNTNKGIVVKSIDGGANFNLCAALPAVVDGLDVTSIHFITPLIGVIGMNDYVLKTIDGGATWIVMNNGFALSTSSPSPGTAIPVGPITGIYMTDDQAYIAGIGANMIVETIPVISPNPPSSAGSGVDSWRNNFYTLANGFSALPIGYHMIYLRTGGLIPNDVIISVSGYSALGIHSTDRAASWITPPAPGYDVTGNGFNRIAAHFYRLNNPLPSTVHSGFYNKNSDVYHNINGFDPASETFSETSPYGVQALWTWYQEMPDPQTCYTLTECTSGNTIITNTNLVALLGSVITIVGYPGCYTVSDSADCVGAIFVTVVQVMQDCSTCNPSCWRLTDCNGNVSDIITSSDVSVYVGQVITLSNFPGVCWQVSDEQSCGSSVPLTGTITASFPDCINCLNTCYLLTDCAGGTNPITILTITNLSAYVGSAIQLSGYPGICWSVSVAPDCNGSTPLTSTITAQFSDCPSCLQKCFVLVDCTNQNPNVITSTDLSALIGKIIKIKGCPDTCWTVFNSATCIGSVSIVFDSFYTNCKTCLNIIVPDIILKPRSVYPNYNVSGECSIEYIEKVNCNFAEQVYDRMIVKRYGLKSCVEDEYNKYLVKKQLLDLDLTKDPNACKATECCAPCNLSVEFQVFTPTSCQAPSNVTVGFTVPVSCPPPEDVDAAINF